MPRNLPTGMSAIRRHNQLRDARNITLRWAPLRVVGSTSLGRDAALRRPRPRPSGWDRLFLMNPIFVHGGAAERGAGGAARRSYLDKLNNSERHRQGMGERKLNSEDLLAWMKL